MIKTGKEPMPVMTYIAILSVCFIINLPGIAIAPIEGRLRELLHTNELEVQLLTTLPNFVIIPFVFISGKLSGYRHKIPLIFVSLVIFIACGIIYFFSNSIVGLIIASCLLGASDGILIPFAMGFIVNAFEGKLRTRNLGIKSATSNFGTVVASYVVGLLFIGSNWHIPFLVYLVAIVPLVLCGWLKHIPGYGESDVSPSQFQKECMMKDKDKGIDFPKIWGLMTNNAVFTFLTFAFVIYIPQLVQSYGWTPNFSARVLTVFFLSVFASGFILEHFLRLFKSYVYPLLGLLLAIGLCLTGFIMSHWAMYVGSVSAGLAFGIFQPLVYDKTSYAVKDPNKNIFGLSLVLVALYLAIAVEPFIITGISDIFHVKNINLFAFRLSFYATLIYMLGALIFRHRFTFHIGPELYL